MQGATSGDDIYLDKGLTQRQRRCALMHELIHWEHDHDGHQPPGVEAEVDRLASVALIDLPNLRDALQWGRNLWEAAEYLSVTERLLVVRLQSLTDGERRLLDHTT
jgi:Zn-dependent peptidase ImmA (M78 family)